jgi:hypothetical protein
MNELGKHAQVAENHNEAPFSPKTGAAAEHPSRRAAPCAAAAAPLALRWYAAALSASPHAHSVAPTAQAEAEKILNFPPRPPRQPAARRARRARRRGAVT